MLGDAGHAFFVRALHALDVLDAHAADEVGVLAVGLIGAAPAGVAADVDDRAHGRVDAHGAALLPDDGGHLPGQFWLPGGAHVDLGREQGAAGGGVAAEVLGLEGDGNAQAGLFHKVALDFIGDLGDLLRVHDAHHGILGEAAVPVGEFPAQSLQAHLAVHDEGGGQVAAELGGFFLQRHAGQQVFHALRYRAGRVFVQFHKKLLSVRGLQELLYLLNKITNKTGAVNRRRGRIGGLGKRLEGCTN